MNPYQALGKQEHTGWRGEQTTLTTDGCYYKDFDVGLQEHKSGDLTLQRDQVGEAVQAHASREVARKEHAGVPQLDQQREEEREGAKTWRQATPQEGEKHGRAAVGSPAV